MPFGTATPFTPFGRFLNVGNSGNSVPSPIFQGFLFFQAAFDIDLIASGARQLLEPLGKLS